MSGKVLGDDPFANDGATGEKARGKKGAAATKAPRTSSKETAPRPAPSKTPKAAARPKAARSGGPAQAGQKPPSRKRAKGGAPRQPVHPSVVAEKIPALPATPLPETPREPAQAGTAAPEKVPAETALVPVPRHPSALEHAPRQAYPFAALARSYRSFAMRFHAEEVDPFGLDEKVEERYKPLFEFLYTSYFRTETSGLEHIPDRGCALIVANHAGALSLDGTMLMYAIRREHPAHRRVRPLLEDFVFHAPFLGTILNRIGGVRACPENAERLLADKQLVAVFPEGIKGTSKLYRERYRLQRFGRGGFVKLALRSGAPIIPAAIIGAEETHPVIGRLTWLSRLLGVPHLPITPTFPWLGPLGLLPLPAKWRIAFGEPIHIAVERGDSAAEDSLLVQRLTEKVRGRVQGMVDDLLSSRRSFLFG